MGVVIDFISRNREQTERPTQSKEPDDSGRIGEGFGTAFDNPQARAWEEFRQAQIVFGSMPSAYAASMAVMKAAFFYRAYFDWHDPAAALGFLEFLEKFLAEVKAAEVVISYEGYRHK